MLINLGSRVPFTDSFPVCQATRKTVALHSTLLVLLGEKSGRWSSSPRHCAFSNRSCAHRFAPKWSALTAPRQQLASPSYTLNVLRALQQSGPWKLNERRMRMRWNTAARGRSRKRARTQWARMPLILNMLKRNLKLLGGFIGNGEPPVYAPGAVIPHASLSFKPIAT